MLVARCSAAPSNPNTAITADCQSRAAPSATKNGGRSAGSVEIVASSARPLRSVRPSSHANGRPSRRASVAPPNAMPRLLSSMVVRRGSERTKRWWCNESACRTSRTSSSRNRSGTRSAPGADCVAKRTRPLWRSTRPTATRTSPSASSTSSTRKERTTMAVTGTTSAWTATRSASSLGQDAGLTSSAPARRAAPGPPRRPAARRPRADAT